MPERIPENNEQLNKVSKAMLKLVGVYPHPDALYCLQLAKWGISTGRPAGPWEIPGSVHREPGRPPLSLEARGGHGVSEGTGRARAIQSGSTGAHQTPIPCLGRLGPDRIPDHGRGAGRPVNPAHIKFSHTPKFRLEEAATERQPLPNALKLFFCRLDKQPLRQSLLL
jgi:hypothetical protein